MDKITIKRDGLPPLSFTGEQIGSGTTRTIQNNDRWTSVTIYRTKGGKFIAEIGHFTCWQGERDSINAVSRGTAAEIVEWLKEGAETLGRVSQQAVEEAAKNEAAFASEWVEVVE